METKGLIFSHRKQIIETLEIDREKGHALYLIYSVIDIGIMIGHALYLIYSVNSWRLCDY